MKHIQPYKIFEAKKKKQPPLEISIEEIYDLFIEYADEYNLQRVEKLHTFFGDISDCYSITKLAEDQVLGRLATRIASVGALDDSVGALSYSIYISAASANPEKFKSDMAEFVTRLDSITQRNAWAWDQIKSLQFWWRR